MLSAAKILRHRDFFRYLNQSTLVMFSYFWYYSTINSTLWWSNSSIKILFICKFFSVWQNWYNRLSNIVTTTQLTTVEQLLFIWSGKSNDNMVWLCHIDGVASIALSSRINCCGVSRTALLVIFCLFNQMLHCKILKLKVMVFYESERNYQNPQQIIP